MSTRTPLLLLASTIILAGCGGGSEPSSDDAFRALLDQVANCISVQAGTKPASEFNAAAAIVASAPQTEVCSRWSPAMLASCADAYSLYSQPFAGQCLRP